MRSFWIILIAFACVYFSQGNSLPIQHQTEEDISKVLNSASIKNGPEGHNSDTDGISADNDGFKYSRRQADTLQRRIKLERSDARSRERTSKGSYEITSDGLHAFSPKHISEKGISKKIMRLLKLRYKNVAPVIGRVLENSNYNLDEASGMDHQERNDHAVPTVPGEVYESDGWGSDDNSERGLSKKIMRLIKLRYKNVAPVIGKVFGNSNHDLDEASGLDQQEWNDHATTVPGDADESDEWRSDDNSERGISKKIIVRLLKLRYKSLAPVIGRVFENSNHNLNEVSGPDQQEGNDHVTTVPDDAYESDEWRSDDDEEVEEEELTSGDAQHDSLESQDYLDDLEREGFNEPYRALFDDDEDNVKHSEVGLYSLEWNENGEQTMENDELSPKDDKNQSDEPSETGSAAGDDELASGDKIDDSVESADYLDLSEWRGNKESHASRQKREEPERGRPKRSIEQDTLKKQHQMPASGVRWTGVSMAHHRSRDGAGNAKKSKRNKNEDDDVTGSFTLFLVLFVVAAVLVVLLMAAFFIYSWPVRRYYSRLCQQMSTENVESGWYNYEFQGDQADPNYPEYPAGIFVTETGDEFIPSPPLPPPTPRKAAKPDSAAARKPANAKKGVRSYAKSNLDKTSRRSLQDVLCEDRKRDYRNAERRKIIHQLTSQRRNSLVDSLLAAKEIIDDYAKNKEFEEKASERRHKIKQFNSVPGAPNQTRRKSFVEEIQNACLIFSPSLVDDIKLEQTKEKCRRIKDEIARKRRPSLLDEIEVAKSVIMKNPQKYALSPGLIEEMISVGLDPSDYCSYYVMDYSKGPSKTE